MLSIGGTTRVSLAVQPVDLRGSFNRLYGYVFGRPSGESQVRALVRVHQSQTIEIKILVFDGTGLWILNKRLEAGKFGWPVSDRAALSVRNEEFGALVNGLEVTAKKNWYRE